MGKVVLALWIAALAFAGFWFGYYQEGANRDITIEMDAKMSMTVQGGPVQVEFHRVYASRNKLAMEGKIAARGFGGRCRIIYDVGKKEQVVVLDDQKRYIKTSFELVDKSECEPAKAMLLVEEEDSKRLPDSKAIAGYRCHAFSSTEGTLEKGKGWFTYEIQLGRSHVALVNKLLRMKTDGGVIFGGGASGKKRKQVSSFDYFPVPLLARIQSPQGPLVIQVKSVSRGKIAKSVFEVPSGYEERK